MRILITGGTGFVGSNLAKRLLKDGHEITLIDNMFTSSLNNIDDISEHIEFFNIDLANENNINMIDNILSNNSFDVVYHLAASIGVKLVQEKPNETLQNSFKINNNLFPLFEKHDVKVIFSSTSEIYGETENENGSSETDVLKILAPGKPRGSYACSKLMSEFLLKSYNVRSVIVRFFNIVGQGQVDYYGHVLPKFIKCAKENIDIPVFNDGKMVRSYCDIRDAVEMLVLLLNKEHDGEIYNIGNDKNKCSVLDLANHVIRIKKSKSKISFIPFEEALGAQFEEIYVRYPNTEKIKKYYECKYSIEDIIKGIV